jgi:cytochrome d ubiquinol oxidase subunit I
VDAGGRLQLDSLGALLLNPWAFWQYLHTMLGAVMTGAFAMAGVGAFYLLGRRHEAQARLYVRTGVVAGLLAALLLAFPTGDYQAQNIAKHQPVTLAAMEGLFETRQDAPLVFVGQPDMEKKRLDNALELPGALSFLTYRRWDAEVKGLDAFPEKDWPQNIPLLYYAYHVMVGLGTLLMLLAAVAAWRLRGGRLFASRPLLWLLVLAIPFPYIANTMGWMTTELGRQPWVIWGEMRTADAYSSEVSAGNALFTLIGFCGIYLVLGVLFLALVFRKLAVGPEPEPGSLPPAPPAPPAPTSHPGHA